MTRFSLFRSTAFRLATIFVGLFLISFVAANVVAYRMVDAYLSDRLDAQLMERVREISGVYQTEGIDGTVAMIGTHRRAVRHEATIYALAAPDGRRLAGSLAFGNVPAGLSTYHTHGADMSNYRLYRQQLGDADLTVGVSFDDTNQLRKIATISLAITTAVVLASGLGAGAVMAFRTRRRISGMAGEMRLVGAGNLTIRLPLSGHRDDIDVLATEVNGALVQLEASVAAMMRVTTDMAHDLKTPISRLYSQLEQTLMDLDCQRPEKPIREALEESLDQINQIVATFDSLLRISQLESGSRKEKFGDLDIRAIIAEMAEIYRPIVEDSGRFLRLEGLDAGPAEIFGDAALLRQIYANLLDNAIRYTPSGTTITLGLELRSSHALTVVSDNGPGVAGPDQDRIFARFYRCEASRTSHGTGLGLSLVKAVVDLHGGRIHAEDNRPGLRIAMSIPLRSATV